MADMFRPLIPLMWFCKLFSVWPYKSSFSLKSVDIYYRFLIFSVDLISLYYFTGAFITNRNKSTIMFVSLLVNLFAVVMLQTTTLICGFVNKQHMANLMSEFILVDQELFNIGSQDNIKDTCVFQSIIIATLVGLIIPSASNYWMIYGTSYQLCIYIISSIQHLCVPIMLTGLAFVIKSRYRSLNTQLSSLLQGLPTTPLSLQRLRKLVNIHNKLRGIVQKINSTFSIQVLVFILYTVTKGFVSSLLTLQSVKSGKLLDHVDTIWLFSILRCSVLIVLLTEECRAAASEGNKAVFLIHRMLERDTHISILKEIERFSLGMIRNYIKFSAGGFLVIDRALLIKICVHITTLLVISLQVEDIKVLETTTPLIQTALDNTTVSL